MSEVKISSIAVGGDTMTVNVDAFTYNVATAVSSSKFKIDLDYTLVENDIVKVSFPSAIDNFEWVQLSVDDGLTYRYIKTDEELYARDVENKDVELKLTGTYFSLISGATPSFSNPTSVATALDSASGWTATGNGILVVGGRATTSATGHYFVTDKTIGGNVLLISMEVSSYNSCSIPIISGHVYSRTIGGLTTEDKISNFYAFN